MGGVGTVILIWGGRCSTVGFFFSGGSHLCYPFFPPGYGQGLTAAFFIMAAMIFLVTTEGVAAYVTWVRLLRESDDPKAPQRLRGLLSGAFAVFGMAANAIASIRRATVDRLDTDNKPTKTEKNPKKRGDRTDKANSRVGRDQEC